jgi:CSLREA domain-containing protein
MRRLIPLAVLCTALLAAPSALANTYVVNKTGDHAPGKCKPSDCTLREAVIKANGHSGSDTILLHGGTTYELTRVIGVDNETDGDLDLGRSGVGGRATIKSSNGRLATIDANAIDGVIDVLENGATFDHLKIKGGVDATDEGGGIDVDTAGSSTKIVDSRINGNSALFGGGVDAGLGPLSILRSKINGNHSTSGTSNGGGGISSDGGPTKIVQSTIAGNDSETDGGGIYVDSPLTLKSSTVSGNTADSDGGGIYSEAAGASSLKNDTIANNRADTHGGGIDVVGGKVSLNAVTIAYNLSDANGGGAGDGGGINEDGGVGYAIKNSIIARNSSGTQPTALGPNCHDANANTIVSGGHNLIGDNTDCDGFQTGALSSDRVNRSDSQVGIGSLKSNGGPTKTIALKSGSQAIDHAGSDAPSKDQRGVRRNDSGGPDIGAYERN